MQELDFAYKLRANELIYLGQPRQIRNDCQIGQWKAGASKMLGDEMIIQPIAAIRLEGRLFNYPHQVWIHLAFVDPEGFICTTLLKKESMDNFFEIHRESLKLNKPLWSLKLKASLSQRANPEGKHYAVVFKIEGEGQWTEQIQAFLENRPPNLLAVPVKEDE